jgi:tripartite-type tricarboxylate transporter receptor subunit TctC
VFAPGGTPRAVTDRFARLIADILHEEKNARMLSESEFEIRLNGPDELKTFFAGQMKSWAPVVKDHGIKPGE